jgi:short-subunit dehydrogenase
MEKIFFTGARSGIMAFVVDKIKLKKYEIYVSVHTESELEIVRKKYEMYPNIHVLKLDVTSLVDREKIKNLDIDILVINSAVCYGGSISEIDMNLVRKNFEVNVFSNFEVVQLLIRNMIYKNKGKIIFMSSLASLYTVPFIGAYAASKASISKLAFTLRKELSYLNSKVKIVVIEPGFYHTGFNQVMFENKYDWMDFDSYFFNVIDGIRRKEKFIQTFIERKSVKTVEKKIVKAITSRNPKVIYRVPFLQSVVAKGYQIFFE